LPGRKYDVCRSPAWKNDEAQRPVSGIPCLGTLFQARQRRSVNARKPHLQGLRNGEGGNRTHDTTIFSRVLYQLSYLA
jgi:hypothetical protein